MKFFTLLLLLITGLTTASAREWSRASARTAMNDAIAFFRSEVATEGGYLWRYSPDLSRREGEGKAGPTTIWVQPPGTPAVGLALLEVWELTGERTALAGAVDAARALVRGQLKSGGWNYRIEFNPDDRVRWVYRGNERHSRKARNTSVLDDNNTQAALAFLMRVDQTLKFKDPAIHECVRFGLQSVLDAQFDSGAFPQAFDGTVDPSVCARRKARFPETWSREYQGHQQYWYRPTLNDNLIADAIGMLFLAGEVYDDAKYTRAAEKAGEFLLLAQLPDPQPGWAQQYSYDMEPMWARKFEPVSITGGESRGAMLTLIDLYRRTGDKKWVAPLPRALAYYRSLRLSDGRLARFYEIGTDKPLYFTRDYKLTYDDSDMPTHYAFKISDWTGQVERELKKALQGEKAAPPQPNEARARKAFDTLDKRGAWVTDGWIECRDFNRNIVDLARWVGR